MTTVRRALSRIFTPKESSLFESASPVEESNLNDLASQFYNLLKERHYDIRGIARWMKVKENKRINFGNIKPSLISYPSKIIGTFPELSFTITFIWDDEIKYISHFLVKFNDNKEILINYIREPESYIDKETIDIYTEFFKKLNSRIKMLPKRIDQCIKFQFE
jgi:hypothetical protein